MLAKLRYVFYIFCKLVRDLALTLYDDFDFQYISLPRIAFATSIIAVVISWIADQFFGLKYAQFGSLVAWCTACGGAYAAKKFADKDRQYDDTIKK